VTESFQHRKKNELGEKHTTGSSGDLLEIRYRQDGGTAGGGVEDRFRRETGRGPYCLQGVAVLIRQRRSTLEE